MTDNRLAKMPLANWGGLSFKCRCGNLHQIDVKEFVIKQDACDYIAHFAKKMGRTMHLVFEQSVFDASKDKVTKKLGKGFDVTTSIIKDKNLLDKNHCDEILAQAKEQTKVIVCIGGENACQYGKYASQQLGVQWIFVNLVPNGDDFATNYACLWDDGAKRILPGKSPDVILCDTDLAYQFCLQYVDEAYAIILQNALFAFDRDFAKKVQNKNICDVANFVIINAVKDVVELAKKPFSKNTVSEIFACQYKISVAKCLSNQNQDNFAGVHAFSFALQTKYPQYTTGQLACVVADVLSKVYAEVLDKNCLLTIDKDRLAHEIAVQQIFGLQIESPLNFDVNNDAFQKNIQTFKQNLSLVTKTNNLCKAVAKQKPEWESQVGFDCLSLCTDIYNFNGLLSFANDKGMFDNQKD